MVVEHNLAVDGPDLGSLVLDLLKTHDVEPRRLGLEMTETAAIRSLAAARALAVRLTEAGCGVAITVMSPVWPSWP